MDPAMAIARRIPRVRYEDVRQPECSAVLAALEEARLQLMEVVRRDNSVAPQELSLINVALQEISALTTGMREYARQVAPTAAIYEPLASESIRVAVQSAVEAARRGDVDAARRRAEIALWAAETNGEEDLTWMVATLLDLIVRPTPRIAPPRIVPPAPRGD
jgi:hypothetical protein